MAREEIPSIPPSPKILPIRIPTTAPARNLANVRTMPRLRTSPAWRTLICEPTQNIVIAIPVPAAPGPQREVVRPPICNNFGHKVLTRMPRRRGTTIIPPGTFFTVCKIFIINFSFH